MYGVVICDNSGIELRRGRMIKLQSNKSMTPLYVDTHFEYELDMKLFPGLNNPGARIQPSLMIHKDDGCPCQQNADIDLPNLIGKFLSIILEAIRDRPFNLKGRGFCFVQNFFFGQHKRIFFSRI